MSAPSDAFTISRRARLLPTILTRTSAISTTLVPGTVRESSTHAASATNSTATVRNHNNLRQTVHTHRASVHQATKMVAALLRVAGVTAGLLKVMAAYRRVYDSGHLQADCQEPGSAPEPYAW